MRIHFPVQRHPIGSKITLSQRPTLAERCLFKINQLPTTRTYTSFKPFFCSGHEQKDNHSGTKLFSLLRTSYATRFPATYGSCTWCWNLATSFKRRTTTVPLLASKKNITRSWLKSDPTVAPRIKAGIKAGTREQPWEKWTVHKEKDEMFSVDLKGGDPKWL